MRACYRMLTGMDAVIGRVLEELKARDLAGLKVPGKYHGRSLVPLRSGDTPPDWREEFFCEHHSTNPRISEWLGLRGKRYSRPEIIKLKAVAVARQESPD